ncbi:MAG: T9SS type A sorting domain-containing protein, partial [Chloroflexota bacterium]
QVVRSTTDGGETWRDIYLDSSWWANGYQYYSATVLLDIAHPSKDLIIAVGDSGKIVRSTNNGVEWKLQCLGKEKYLKTIKMYDENYGIIFGSDRILHEILFYETSDGGENWRKMNMPKELTDSILYGEFHILRPGYFVVVLSSYGGKDPRIIHVHGDWDSLIVYPQPHIDGYRKRFVYFADENRGWVLGGGKPDKENPTAWDQNQVICYTNNGGKSWTTQRDTLFYYGDPILDTDFFNDRFGIATTFYGYAFLTYNGGRTWEEIHIDDNPPGAAFTLYSPQLTSYSSGYVIVDLQYIYKFTRDWSIPHDTSGSPDDSVKSFIPSPPPGIVRFLGNYPNPFSERTKIAYYLGEPRQVSLKIYDMRGKELETILEDYQGEGYHETDYVNKTLPPGIYYYRLRAGDRTFTRKMIVVGR